MFDDDDEANVSESIPFCAARFSLSASLQSDGLSEDAAAAAAQAFARFMDEGAMESSEDEDTSDADGTDARSKLPQSKLPQYPVLVTEPTASEVKLRTLRYHLERTPTKEGDGLDEADA